MTVLTVVLSEVVGEHGPASRTRVVLEHPTLGVIIVDEHLRVELPASDTSSLLADVLLTAGKGQQDIAKLRARNPGALVIAVHRGPRCWMRLGHGSLTMAYRARQLSSAPAWGIWASLAHTWIVAGLPAAAMESAVVQLVGHQSAAWSSSRASWARTVSASADSERLTEEWSLSASR